LLFLIDVGALILIVVLQLLAAELVRLPVIKRQVKQIELSVFVNLEPAGSRRDRSDAPVAREKSGEPSVSLWRPSPSGRFGPAFQSSANRHYRMTALFEIAAFDGFWQCQVSTRGIPCTQAGDIGAPSAGQC
jgi:hypothetical protein